ncbi:MAG: hypothetical protein P8Y70_15620 [Candidatus Lokiarchaeota archaeon]
MPSRLIRTDDINSVLKKLLSKGYMVQKKEEFKDFWNHFSIKATLKSEKGRIKFLGTHSSECKDVVVLRTKNSSLLEDLPLN